MSRRLVIANRGEIARRILRAARARGYTVAVVSTPDDAGKKGAGAASRVERVPGAPPYSIEVSVATSVRAGFTRAAGDEQEDPLVLKDCGTDAMRQQQA